jgi:fatty acid desaturase
MRRAKFEKEKAKYERRKKRDVTDDEFERVMRRKIWTQWLGAFLGMIIGLAMIAEWPGPWLGPLTTYVGWLIVVVWFLTIVRDAFTREGAFYRLDK